LSALPLYDSLNYLGYSQSLGRAVQEAEAIKESALSAFIGGPGNIRKVSVQLSEAPGSFSLTLGGSDGEGRSRTIDVLYHGDLAATVVFEDQGLSIIGPEGKSMIIEGKQEVRLTCCEGVNGDVVLAEII